MLFVKHYTSEREIGVPTQNIARRQSEYTHSMQPYYSELQKHVYGGKEQFKHKPYTSDIPVKK